MVNEDCYVVWPKSALSWHSGMQHGQKMTGSDLKITAVLEAQSCLLIHEMARFKSAKFAVFMDLFSELLFFSHTSLVHIWLLVHGQICMSSNIKHPHFSHVLPITISCCVVLTTAPEPAGRAWKEVLSASYSSSTSGNWSWDASDHSVPSTPSPPLLNDTNKNFPLSSQGDDGSEDVTESPHFMFEDPIPRKRKVKIKAYVLTFFLSFFLNLGSFVASKRLEA